MANNLKGTYDASNMVVNSGLSITYRQEPQEWGYQITRIAKKSYRFIGLTEAAARECVAAKRAQYTRGYKRVKVVQSSAGQSGSSASRPEVEIVYECPTDVASSHEAGMWSVTISVNEQDIIASTSGAVADPAALFTAENARNYDEASAAAVLQLTSASCSAEGALSVVYVAGLPDLDPQALIVQVRSPSAVAWRTVGSVADLPIDLGTAPDELVARLIFGRIESNVVTVEIEA